jgi:hypothetical protein
MQAHTTIRGHLWKVCGAHALQIDCLLTSKLTPEVLNSPEHRLYLLLNLPRMFPTPSKETQRIMIPASTPVMNTNTSDVDVDLPDPPFSKERCSQLSSSAPRDYDKLTDEEIKDEMRDVTLGCAAATSGNNVSEPSF